MDHKIKVKGGGQECPPHTVCLARRTGLLYHQSRGGVHMPEKKPYKPQVAGNPIADVFDGRTPSPGRKTVGGENPRADSGEISREDRLARPPASISTSTATRASPRFRTCRSAGSTRMPIFPKTGATEKYLGYPGQPPYTRGIHATGYRGKLWTMRQFSGFASPEETNQRYKYLLEHGGGGLSVAFDLPTLMGYDSDHPASEGEVGKCGVAIDSLEDMEILFDGIDLEKTTVSMTINSPASVLWAMYLVVAEKQGADWKKISGTIQNDILKEYIAQKEYIYPPAPSMRLVIDTFEFGSQIHAALQHDFDQRISHPRGRFDCAAGTGIHDLRRRGVRGVGAAPRARRGRLRPAAELLLQRA